jgi:hypothetical protein
MELRELVFSKEPYEMFNVGTAAIMALFDKNDELVRQLADEKADHQSSLDAWSENLKKVGERKDALELELAEARKAAEWVPVRERMPDNSKAVLVWCPERKNKYTACWKVPYWLHFGGACSSEVTEDVTHWKPLPNPPEKLSK